MYIRIPYGFTYQRLNKRIDIFVPRPEVRTIVACDGDQEFVFDVQLSNMALKLFLSYIIKPFFQFYSYSVILILTCYHFHVLILFNRSVVGRCFCLFSIFLHPFFFLYLCSRHR